MTHAVKTWKEYFLHQQNGTKLFELRFDDRNYQIGDTFLSQEYDHVKKEYTGKEINFSIAYILRGKYAELFGLKKGYCILQLKEKVNQ